VHDFAGTRARTESGYAGGSKINRHPAGFKGWSLASQAWPVIARNKASREQLNRRDLLQVESDGKHWTRQAISPVSLWF